MNVNRMPPLTALRAFEAAARTGSLTQAAIELNVTHAAISQQVKRLEAWFHTPLLRRAGRGVEPTAEGALYAAELVEGFNVLRQASEALSHKREVSPLKITSTPAFASNWLLPRLQRFSQRNPDVGFTIAPTTEAIDFGRSDYDVAFRYGPGGWKGMETELAVRSNFILVGARDLVARYSFKRTEDFAAAPWVQETGTDEAAKWLASRGVDMRPSQSIEMPADYCLAAIRDGQGLGLVVRLWIEDDLKASRLIELASDEADPNRGYHLCYHAPPHRPYVKAFLSWAREEIAADPALMT